MEEFKDPRKTFGLALVDAARKNDRIVALSADSSGGSGMTPFREQFPERHFEFGIMEQGITGFASGLATTEKRCVGLRNRDRQTVSMETRLLRLWF